MTVESQAADATGVVESSDNLWETVLREVGSTKAIATKKVVILGDSNSGKTGVVTQLFQASLTPQIGNGQDGGAQSMTTGMGRLNEPFAEVESAALSKHELALTYSYMDVRDEDNEETVARLGIYQLASDRITDRELLRFVLDAKSFPHAAAVIVLDWSRPWRFVKSLLRWINVLSHATEQVCSDTGGRATGANSNWTVGRATVDECRERLERFLQEYSEDESPANATKTADVLLPLGSGVLSSNLGLPLVVVCTKSDTMGVLERERGFSEEDFDYVQQVLRAVCLRFGAALIYTSTHNPATFATLYHYLVHRLLSGSNKPLSTYPFRVRASVVDRDVVFVPGGWDSIAKIGYLREPFDVGTIQDAW
ncbi:DLIC-domain-containing protein, partial [Coemansia reversa NRRL 1564]